MISVVLIGFGTIGAHLFDAFSEAKAVRVVQVYNRTGSALTEVSKPTTTNLSDLVNADVYIIATSDDSIKGISEQLHIENKLVVHTSGSVGIESLSGLNRKGSFYPIQTFSKDRKINFKTVPICIEAENKIDLDLLYQLASELSESVSEITSEQRKSLHLAAVFVNNFTNHLFYLGTKICEENKVSFAVLSPLIQETVAKLDNLDPFNAQTGPAKRGDTKTLEQHLAQIKQNTTKEIYKTISKSIKTTYGKKL